MTFGLAPGGVDETVLTYEALVAGHGSLTPRRSGQLEDALHDHVHDVVERVAEHAVAVEQARRALR